MVVCVGGRGIWENTENWEGEEKKFQGYLGNFPKRRDTETYIYSPTNSEVEKKRKRNRQKTTELPQRKQTNRFDEIS